MDGCCDAQGFVVLPRAWVEGNLQPMRSAWEWRKTGDIVILLCKSRKMKGFEVSRSGNYNRTGQEKIRSPKKSSKVP